MAISLAPYFNLLTMQIETRGGQNIWLDVEDGMSVIYGLNGTGKTTIVNGINRLFRGEEEKFRERMSNLEYYPGRSRGYFGFPVDLFMCEIASEVFLEFDRCDPSDRDSNVRFPAAHRNYGVRGFERHGIPVDNSTDNKEESISSFKTWYLDEWLDNQKQIPTRDLLLEELNDDSSSDAKPDIVKLLTGLILEEAIERQGHALFNPFGVHDDFISNLRTAIGTKFTNWEFSKPNATYANQLGIEYGVEFNFDDDTFADRGFGDSSSTELLDLYLYLLIEKFHNTISESIDECDWFIDDERFDDLRGKGLLISDCIEDAAGLVKIIFSAIRESLSTPVFWFEPANERNINRIFGLALDLSVRTSTNSSIVKFKELITRFEKDSESELKQCHYYALFYVFQESKLICIDAFNKFDGFESGWPYLNLGYNDGIGELKNLPLQVVDISKSIDFDVVAQKTLVNLLREKGTEASFSMDGYFGEGVLEIPNIETVNNHMEKISLFLQRLDIGIKRCKFEYSEDLTYWVTGQAAKFVFETISTSVGTHEIGIPFSRLSSAQQYWAQAAFWLISVESSDEVCLVTADEPESGLHERAIIQVFNELSKTKSSCVITSHSSRALRLPSARLLHLERIKSGELVLGRPWLGEDIASAAERLGTTTFDLFALKRALVIVEGSHDVEVVKSLASLHVDGTLLDQLLIVPARGVKNVATVADSVVITEFTSLHVLAITDNGRAEMLKGLISKASDALNAGASPGQAIAVSGIRDVDRESTFEERVMLDLIERAIHRGMLHRLHIYALAVQDIVDLLPEKAFGLDGTWEELRSEHQSFPVKMSFKDWLRQEKGVSVSVKSVKKAFDSIDALSEPLQSILHELEIISSLSPLDGGR